MNRMSENKEHTDIHTTTSESIYLPQIEKLQEENERLTAELEAKNAALGVEKVSLLDEMVKMQGEIATIKQRHDKLVNGLKEDLRKYGYVYLDRDTLRDLLTKSESEQ